MTLRRIKNDNSVKYIRKTNSTRGEYSPPETSPKPNTASFPQKQNKNFRKIKRTSLKILPKKDLEYVKRHKSEPSEFF